MVPLSVFIGNDSAATAVVAAAGGDGVAAAALPHAVYGDVAAALWSVEWAWSTESKVQAQWAPECTKNAYPKAAVAILVDTTGLPARRLS